ncbi:MAG: LacI family DNA-binding transcriptional regulator [Capsulimonadaceae bacterium]
METRIRDVAEAAGVSVTTAAHVLRGYTKSRIKQETVDKVNKIAGEMGYRPNAIARSLKTRRTNAVGMYTGFAFRSLRDPFLAAVYTGVQLACRELRYDFVVHGDIDGKTPNEIRLKLSDGKVAGLVVHAPSDDPVVACLAQGTIPAVAIADKQLNISSVVADDVQGMTVLIDYLWSRGHRRFAFLTSSIRLDSVDIRRKTFESLVTARGGLATVATCPLYGTDDPLLNSLLEAENRPTAACCWNDYFAYDLVGAILRRGLRIPEDLAVVGFDGLLERQLPARRLVTAAVPWEDMAAEAVRLLVKQIDGEQVPDVTTFPVTLIEGDTA